MSCSPVVSILMPFKNSELYIVEAVTSVLLSKDLQCELIAIDDSSLDGSRRILETHGDTRLTVVANKEGPGVAGALNTGLRAAQGKYVGVCGSDNRRWPQSFAKQIEYMERHEEFVAVCGGYIAVSAHGSKLSDLNSADESCEITDDLLGGNVKTALGTYLVRRDAISGLFFRDWFKSAEDIDFQYRLADRGRVYFMKGSYYEWRIHSSSITHKQKSVVREFFSESARQFRQQRSERGNDDLEIGSPPAIPDATGSKPNTAIEHSVSLLVGSAWDSHRRGKKGASLKSMLRAIALRPLRPALWIGLTAIIVKSP